MKRILPFILCAAVLLNAATAVCFAVTQNDLNVLMARRDAITAEKQAQQKVLDGLMADQNDVIEQKLALEEHVSLTQEQIRLNEDEIELYNGMIADKQKEVDAARELEELQLERYRSRVRAMEENGELDVLGLIFQADSIGSLIAAIDDAGDIMESDKHLEDAYIAARKAHEAVKAEYEEYKAEIEEKQSVLIDEANQLRIEISATQEKIDALQAEINENQELADEIEARWSAANSELAAAQELYDAQHAAPGSLSGAGFIWPTGSTYITSREGNRIHPVSGDYKYHSGMDVGGGAGDSVWASADGTVTLAGWNGDYGNCVIITHDNGYQTLYAHLSDISVSEGSYVGSGESIGSIGSTGLATGPHLHYEIRSGGCLDPEAFFGSDSFQFAPDSGE